MLADNLKLSLHPDAQRWRKLWSMRMAIAGALGTAAIGALFYFTAGFTWTAFFFFCLNFFWYGGTAVSRVIKQTPAAPAPAPVEEPPPAPPPPASVEEPPPAPPASAPSYAGKATAAAAALAMATAAFTTPFEGFEPVAKHEAIDRHGVITYGIGTTNADVPGLKIGDTITKPEAEALLADKLATKYLPPLRICIPHFDQMPRSRQIAFLDAAYNLGYGGVCKSSMTRRINAGDTKGACAAFLLYDGVRQADGTIKVYPGLVRRRKAERSLCLQEG